MMVGMTQAPLSAEVPSWTVGDRLGKALNHAGIGVGEMATYLGLSRNSVSAYINDRQAAKRPVLILWAMRTGVALEWLETGEASHQPTPPPNGGRAPDALTRLTEQKQRRSRSTGTTRRYLAPAFAAA